jgi:catechol 2,3-dioxygenase
MHFHQKPFIYPGEVCLKVTNIDRSHQFYTTILGLTVLSDQTKTITYTTDGTHPLLTITCPQDVVDKQVHTTGLYHFALLLPNRVELGRMLIHLIQKKVQLGAADHAVSEALYITDPDGNEIEIYCDRDPSTWEWKDDRVVMTTEELNGRELLAEGSGSVLKRLPQHTKMGHIHLHVDNLITAMKFYTQLGFEVVSQYPQALFLSNGKYHHHIAINTWNGAGAKHPEPNQAGLDYFTLHYPNQEQLSKVVGKLDAPVEYVDNLVRIQDPAGNHIILKVAA